MGRRCCVDAQDAPPAVPCLVLELERGCRTPRVCFATPLCPHSAPPRDAGVPPKRPRQIFDVFGHLGKDNKLQQSSSFTTPKQKIPFASSSSSGGTIQASTTSSHYWMTEEDDRRIFQKELHLALQGIVSSKENTLVSFSTRGCPTLSGSRFKDRLQTINKGSKSMIDGVLYAAGFMYALHEM